MILIITLFVSCLKLLLIPAYHSTDFEVHRNWLAITHTLPTNKWYYEDTSEWTLDYPPFFAWFEYLLSFIARLFDENMLIVNNLNYESKATIFFQRISVIVMDFLYYYGVYRCCKVVPAKGWKTDVVLPILLIANCGLIMLDHIHFQYNGFMYGILLLSISYMWNGQYIKSALWFTALLNFKHIYLYAAPAYFIFLLKNYCLQNKSVNVAIRNKKSWLNTIKLGSVVIGVFFLSFGPFLDHLPQVMSRLFPVKRGLCHAYWAPNIWALYNIMDKCGFLLASKLGFVLQGNKAVMTGGLVQEYSHSFLPNISPEVTVLITLVMITPCLYKLWKLNKGSDFVPCIILCSLTSFLFGWHVHEKAILMAVIPLTILCVIDSNDARIFLILTTVGHYSLFPLLFPKNLLLVKTLLLILYSMYSFHSLSKIYTLYICKYSLPLLNIFESLYLLGFSFIYLYENIVHNFLGLQHKLPFLPLMLTSAYCSVGVLYCWIVYYVNFLKRTEYVQNKLKNK